MVVIASRDMWRRTPAAIAALAVAILFSACGSDRAASPDDDRVDAAEVGPALADVGFPIRLSHEWTPGGLDAAFTVVAGARSQPTLNVRALLGDDPAARLRAKLTAGDHAQTMSNGNVFLIERFPSRLSPAQADRLLGYAIEIEARVFGQAGAIDNPSGP